MGMTQNNVCPYFQAALVSMHANNIIIIAANSKQTSVRKICNFTINRDCREVIYTCRYSNGHFNLYNSANGLNFKH